mgnify:CR=1 FL=1
MPNFHAYRRVSDDKQLDGNSLETQDHILRKFHAYKYPDHGYLDYFDPAVSAKIHWFARPAGGVLWSQVAKGAIIVTSMFDRAFRSLNDLVNSLEKLAERGVKLHCLDLPVDVGTDEGRAFFQMFGIFKELERKTIGKRVRADNQRKRDLGIPLATTRHLGYKRKGQGVKLKWIPWQEERAFGQRLVVLHTVDLISHDDIYLLIQREMNKKTLTFTKGKMSPCYLLRLYHAARAGFPLPGGGYIPGTAKEYLEWLKKQPDKARDSG